MGDEFIPDEGTAGGGPVKWGVIRQKGEMFLVLGALVRCLVLSSWCVVAEVERVDLNALGGTTERERVGGSGHGGCLLV